MKHLMLVLSLVFLPLGVLAGDPMAGNPENVAVEVKIDDKAAGDKNALVEEIAREIDEEMDSLSPEEKQELIDATQKIATGVEMVISELTDEEREELVQALRDLKDIRIDADTGVGGAILGALAIVFSLGMPIIIVAIALYAGYRKRRLVHETINQFISAGKEVPPEILANLEKQTAPRNNLHSGISLSGIGLGIMGMFYALGEPEVAAIGFIPLFIGLARLLIWKLDKNRELKSV